jgi:glycosyltransferase involved in cell wall biosynthesis
MKLRVLFVITDLYSGGAEWMLHNLLAHLNRDLFECEVVSLRDVGPIGEQIQDMGIPVHALKMRPQRPDLPAVVRLVRIIRQYRPHVVQTWMYHADFTGGLAARFAGRPPVVWGIHHTASDPQTLKPATRGIIRANAWLSHHIPAQIVCCAEATLNSHAAAGYDRGKMVMIPNGFDVTRFQPDQQAYLDFRRESGLPATTPLVGLCARFHPAKDHLTFLKAAGLIATHNPEVRFVLCGENITSGNPVLSEWIRTTGLQDRCLLLGPRQDMPSVLAALDVLVSASRSEAFPLIIGEAMACGVPCAVTHTGDSARIVGETGQVVPPAQPEALAAACIEILNLPAEKRQALGQAARARIETEYNLSVISTRYAQLYRDVAVKGK